MKKLYIKILGGFVISFLLISAIATTIDDFFLPGSQPGQSGTFNDPNQCANCHGGYDESIEPFFTWKGSMMAQAMRDPLYLASMTIANQDAVDSGDLCIRCHSPSGWLEERSTPTDGSALNAMDMENGVQCHFCHKLIDPKSTSAEEPYMLTLTDIPPQSGNGMFVVDSDNNSRRFCGMFFNDFVHFRFGNIWHRLLTILNFWQDPFDTYSEILKMKKEFKISTIFFFLVGDYTTFDKNISSSNNKLPLAKIALIIESTILS